MALRVIGVDDAIAEVADQDVIGKVSEGRGSRRNAPGSIQISAGNEGSMEVSFQIESIDDSEARAGDSVVLCGVLLSVHDHDQVPEDANSVRSVSGGQARIGQITDQVSCVKVAIEDVNLSTVEIGSQKESAFIICHQGEAFVDCAVGGVVDYGDGISLPCPVGDDAVLCIKKEGAIAEDSRLVVSHSACRATLRARIVGGYRNGNTCLGGIALCIVDSGRSAVVVRDPEWLS